MTVRAASQIGMAKINANAAKMGVGNYDNYLSIALGAGDTTVLKLTNAYAILANQGREVKPTLIDYVQNRHGKVIFRTDNRCAVMDGCNAADWNGRAMPRPPSRARQLIDPQAAYQMVHVLEGVVERGTATVLRSLERPLFGKTGTTNGPTNVWFVGGTPDVVAGVYIGYDQPRSMGGAAQGGRIAAPVFKQWAEVALKDYPKTPFVAPAGIRMVRIDRATGRRVYGAFPTTEDPKSSVIWEAFQPETEPRRSFRRSAELAASRAAEKPVQRAVRRTRPARRAARRRPRRQRRILAKPGRHLLGVACTPNRRPSPCAPKRKLISTRSTPRSNCCAASSTGTARSSGSRSSTTRSRIRRCGTTPRRAQEVMRERRRLEEAIAATRKMQTELADTVELIEMAEAEGDDALVDDGVRALAELAEGAERDKVAALLAGRGRRQQQLCRGQFGRRRDREQ